jgi:zinc/manganese transport system substrate-binding protein
VAHQTHTLKRHMALLALPLWLVLSACAPAVQQPVPSTAIDQPAEAGALPTPAATGKIKVIATFSILGDFVKNIAGDKVDLFMLVGPDGDAHDFEPVPSDNVALADAAVIFENGLGFEAWLDDLYAASKSKATRVVASDGIKTRMLELGKNGKSEADPHVWQRADNASMMVKNIERGLSKADPENAAMYATNAAAYLKKLEALDAEIQAEVAKLPAEKRKLVTSHDALGYYAERCGFEIVGNVIASLTTETGEPSAADFAALIDAIKATGAKAIFLERITNPALVERVAKAAGIGVGPELYTDALGLAGSAGSTYIDAMRHNTQAIVNALSGAR